MDYKEYEAQVQKLIDKHITTDGEVLKVTDLVNIFNKKEREAELEKITGKAAKADHIATRTIKAASVKMNDDPIFYKKLSQLIKETIDAYHQQRINEADYLAKAMLFEEEFLSGKRSNIPAGIQENAAAIAYYNLAMEEFKNTLSGATHKISIAEEMALGIDTIIRANVFEQGKQVIDWQNNLDIEGKIKIDIDDFIFDLKHKFNLEIDFDELDTLIAESIKVAKFKYKD